MKFARIVIIFVLLIISIGVVSATENEDIISNDNSIDIDEHALEDSRLQSAQNDEYISESNNYTFTDLNNELNTSVDVVNIEHNYKFNNETDNGLIFICKDNLTINGNNHVIDGNGQTDIFCIIAKNITINNLIFINGNCKTGNLLIPDGGGAIKLRGTLTLNNVTFINNSANYNGGDLFVCGGEVSCLNCNFIDSYSINGNSIYLEGSVLDMKYCNFTSKYSCKWSTVFAQLSDVFIDNCIFTNISSVYAPALFARSGNAIINNSKFNYLKADKTAGAIATKECEQTTIENCLFTNTASVKNGGAVFIDAAGDGGDIDNLKVDIINSTFINASSSFGGAYVQLGCNLTIKDSIFTNCSSEFDGGAVYLSVVDADIVNCKFNSNKAASHDNYPTYGGAVYFDDGILNMAGCEFNNNEAPIAGGLYGYDSAYYLDNITFNNNGNAIYTYFDDNSSKIGRIYGNDKISEDDFNNIFYPSVVIGEGMAFNLTTNIVNLSLLPTKFDLRDIGWITPVRDQGQMGSCWTFGVLDGLESALVKNTGITYSLSENNMQDAMVIYSKYGTESREGADIIKGSAYLLNWFGSFPQEYDSYDELGKISPIIHTNQTMHIFNYVLIDRNTSSPGDVILKEAILKYGVLAVYFDATAPDPSIFNFYSNSTDPDHAVGLVGWDDNYPKENFLNTPPGDGAWIFKNSWSDEWGEGGYGYISYYDTSFVPLNTVDCQAIGYIIENNLPYNKNYQYDFTGLNDFMTYDETDELYGSAITNVNNFVSVGDDLIAAVGTYFNQSGLDYTVEIAVNDVIVYAQNGVSPYRGYHTIELNKYVPIKTGEKFSIYLTSTALGVSFPIRVHYQEGVSLTNYNGIWTDIYDEYGQVACIKAYTLKDDTQIIGNKNITVDYSGGSYFSIKVESADGHAIVGGDVNFTLNGKTYPVKTDSNGIAKIKINELPKKYAITTTYNGKSVKNTINVKHVLTANKVTVKKTANSFALQAKLKINGKLVKGKTITFKFNGKTYHAKTNAKGIAKVTVKKNVIKKLKKGKTYTVKVTYSKDTIKTTLKVQ